jgi:pyruvate kinase
VPIFAVCTHANVARQLKAVWGVRPVLAEDVEVSYEGLTRFGLEAVREAAAGRPGQSVVVTAGFPFHEAGTTNVMRIEQL